MFIDLCILSGATVFYCIFIKPIRTVFINGNRSSTANQFKLFNVMKRKLEHKFVPYYIISSIRT